MNADSQSNRVSKIVYIGDYCDVSVLPISKKRFEDYKKFGLPVTGAAAENWDEHIEAEELLEELAGESQGSMIFSEEFQLNFLTREGIIENLKPQIQGTENIITDVARSAIEIKNGNYDFAPLKPGGDGKNYLIQIAVAKNACYELCINEVCDTKKIAIKISPEILPGGQVINCLLIKYDEKFFDYNYATHNFSKAEFYLADSKGLLFPTEMKDEPSEEIQKILSRNDNLTDWYPAEVNPARVGEYEVELLEGAEWPMPASIDAKWNGKTWKNHFGKVIKIKQWRGLRESS
jgi:hypothetical protein